MAEKYTVSTLSVETVLGYIKSGEIAIPEIQRPFVWKAKQVRDLIDSLYTGYPTGSNHISKSRHEVERRLFGSRKKDNDRWATKNNSPYDSHCRYGGYHREFQ